MSSLLYIYLYLYIHITAAPSVDAYRENGVMVTAIQLIQQNQFTFDFRLHKNTLTQITIGHTHTT